MASNAPAPKSKPLSFMETLSPVVSLYRPTETAPAPPSNPKSTRPPPKLIIFAAWTGAQDQHIAKYITKYQALYPASTILLLKSPPLPLCWSPREIPNAIVPAVPVIKSIFPDDAASDPTNPSLLVHFLSNGGSSSIAGLYDVYGAPLPPHIKVIDSAPSRISFWPSVEFFKAFVPKSAHLVATPLLFLLSGTYATGTTLGLMVDWLKVWGETHNDKKKNPHEMRRLYVYSEEDKLVGWGGIEAHAKEAKERGYKVRMEKFVGTGHVAHARGETEGRYWDLVKGIWEGR
ncbi:hypothetical protein QBC34DRAFT_58569 [Podospora aff. communis PSN243]|uniref:Indole-diterpene biosynthesis protein PaxU n=1 Tax=Podospora aff. communis PSN243 TaxID=3040156 RepID=A0AAV9GU48_9PEZI|nr:hypothetical protein QBC34DRAFT_58569 [Podospora aff. communis PSN243]